MKVEGEDPLPETVAVPLLATEETLQVRTDAFVSTSVAFNSLASHDAVSLSEIVLVNGPTPCVITGAADVDWIRVITTLPWPEFAPASLIWLLPLLKEPPPPANLSWPLI